MPVHLVIETELSKLVGKGRESRDPPCSVWVMVDDSYPVQLDEPHPIVFTDPATRDVRRPGGLIHDLAYEEFTSLLQPRARHLCRSVGQNSVAIPLVLSIARLLSELGHECVLYETCDY